MTDRLDKLMKMHAADPEDADLPYMIAMEYAKADDHAAMLEWLNKTLQLNSDYHYAYYQKAKALNALDDRDGAEAALQQGIEVARRTGHEKALNELMELRAAL